MSKDDLKELIQKEDSWAVGALMKIYSLQNPDEQACRVTRELNDVGFNRYDADFMSKLAQVYQVNGYLTTRQIMYVRKTVLKYIRQLLTYGVEPLEIKSIKQEIVKKEQPKKQASIQEGKIKIVFPYDGDTVSKVKSLDGRWFHADMNPKCWSASLNLDNIEKLLQWDFAIDENLSIWYKEHNITVDQVKAIEVPLKGTLYPFQEKGIGFLEAKKGRALIGDEMGLGKTIQAIGYLALHSELRPAVVVCPASLKLNWEREINNWMEDPKVQVISGRPNNGKTVPLTGEILVINYDILGDWEPILKTMSVKVLILDEVHYCKNNKAKRTKAVETLSLKDKSGSYKGIAHIIALSGTPIINRPVEFFTPLHILDPQTFPSFRNFTNRFTEARYNGFGWDYSKAKNTKELHELLIRTVMLRRLKKDVLTELPPKVRTVIPVDIDNWAEYRKAENDFIEWVRGSKDQFQYMSEMSDLKTRIDNADTGWEQDEDIRQDLLSRYQELKSRRSPVDRAKNAQAVVQIEKLKQICVRGKMAAMKEWINNYLEEQDKLVVFGVHKEVIDLLMEEFKGFAPVKIDGSVSMVNRQAAVDSFQTDPNCKVFVGNIQAAGVGITLTASNSTCFTELGWTPGGHSQAEDRVHRIGQEADSVNAYYIVAKGTIEEKIMLMLDTKTKVLAEVLDGAEVESSSLLSDLLAEYSK